MKIGPITLFQRQHSNGTPIASWTVVSLHWGWSYTWRWALWWSPRSTGRVGLNFQRTYRGRKGVNFGCSVYLHALGSLRLEAQPNLHRNPRQRSATIPEHATNV